MTARFDDDFHDVKSLFTHRGLRYLSRSRITEPRLLEIDFLRHPYYLANEREFIDLRERYGDALRSTYVADIRIYETTDDRGLGVFAAAALAAENLIGEYSGVVKKALDLSWHEARTDGGYMTDYSWEYPVNLPDGTPIELNAWEEGNELRFVNHGTDPNVRVEHTLIDGYWCIFFVADRDIPAGGELLVDYGIDYWSGGFRELIL